MKIIIFSGLSLILIFSILSLITYGESCWCQGATPPPNCQDNGGSGCSDVPPQPGWCPSNCDCGFAPCGGGAPDPCAAGCGASPNACVSGNPGPYTSYSCSCTSWVASATACSLGSCGAECTPSQLSGCGNYASSCAGNCACNYQPASISPSLDVSLTSPCVNETQKSRQFTVSGTSNYCGQINISTSWQNTKVTIPAGKTFTDNYAYSMILTIPENVLQNSIASGTPIRVTVSGNRNSTKNVKDEGDYSVSCTATKELSITYDNFYYCPKEGDTFQDFDYYSGVDYFPRPSWDDSACQSNIRKDACCKYPTDCVKSDGTCINAGSAADTDNDNEIEACISYDNIQGGWADGDKSEVACQAVSTAKPAGLVSWLDCKYANGQKNNECKGAVDDYDSNPNTGACCGDDPNENYVVTLVKDTALSYAACCNSANSCVDDTGICRPVNGPSMCFAGGVKASCQMDAGKAKWVLSPDATCIDQCLLCDVTKNGRVDEFDLSAITNQIGKPYEEIYDSNKDTRIDEVDVIFCGRDSIFQKDCLHCGDNILQRNEQCDLVNDKMDFNCPDLECGRLGYENALMTRIDGFCFGCLACLKVPTCVVGQCGAECTTNDECAPRLSEVCLEDGLNSNGLSATVTKLEGDSGFRLNSKDSWCCNKVGEYYVKNHGKLTAGINVETSGTYTLSFGYRVAGKALQGENLRITCSGRTITIPTAELEANQLGDEFNWYTGLSCIMVPGKNLVTFEADGTGQIYIASVSLIKAGTSTCDTDSCGCVDTGYCGDGKLGPGETCDDTSSKKCPTLANCYTTQNPNQVGYLIGSKEFCDARCVYTQKSCGASDGYCPGGCTNDPDCSPIDKCAFVSSCKNSDGCCPKSCTASNDNDCKDDKCFGITSCVSGDSCCPTGCIGKDNDCGWVPI